MQLLKKLLASVMAVTMTVTATSLSSFAATGKATSEKVVTTRVKWTGYENNVRAVTFDEWDGTSYELDWLDAAAGTQEDPYIIASANDLMGISHFAESGNTTNGKYFKLAVDVDISNCHNCIFKEDIGLDADFNLDGHVIRYSIPLVTEIKANGTLHNGTLVATGSGITQSTSTAYSQRATAIYVNNGLVDNIQIMSNMTFEYKKPEKSANPILVEANYGKITNSIGYCGVAENCTLTKSNIGEILNCTSMSIAFSFFANGARYGLSGNAFIVANGGLVKDLTIDCDTITTSAGNLNANVSIINENTGIVDHLIAKDVTIYGETNYHMVTNNTGTLKNLEITGVTFELSASSPNYVCVVYNQVGILCDSKIDVKTQAGSWAVIGTPGQNRHYTLIDTNLYENTTKEDVSNKDFSYLKQRSGTISNCDIDIEYLPTSSSNTIPLCDYLSSCNYIDCDVNVTGLRNASKGFNTSMYVGGGVVDTSIYLDYVLPASSVVYGNVFGSDVVRSNIHIGRYETARTSCEPFWRIFSSVITIDEAVYYTDGQWVGIAEVTFDTDVIVRKASGATSDFAANNLCKFSRYMVTYSGEFEFVNNYRYGTNNAQLINSEFYYTFEDNAVGTFNTLFGTSNNVNDRVVNDCFIYIGAMPKDVKAVGGGLVSTAAQVGAKGNTGIVLIAPHINVATAEKQYYGNFSALGYGRLEDFQHSSVPPQNCYVDVNLYFENTDNINYVSGSAVITNGFDASQSNSIFNINVYDGKGKDLNMPVYAVAVHFPNPIHLGDVLLRSNTLSTKSGILYCDEAWALTQFIGNGTPIELKNDVLILPNAKNANETVGLAYANHYSSQNSSNFDDTIGVLMGIMQKTGIVKVNNCKVFAESNGSYTTSLTYTLLKENADGYASDIQDVISVLNDRLEKTHIKFESEEDDVKDGLDVYECNNEATGATAYLLDNGGTASRTYNYTIGDETCFIVNTFTGDQIYELPPVTVNSQNAALLKYLDKNANLNPIFKATAVPQELGYLKLAGLGNTKTDKTVNELYAKQDAYLVSDVVLTGTDRTFLKTATQTINGVKTEIPDTPLSRARSLNLDYSIAGYTQPRGDVILTPAFDNYYRIDVDIIGSEHGTIVPSANVALENDKITLTEDIDRGYKFVDLKIDGRALTDADMVFDMPAKDVKITGKCVAQDTTAKITSFTLLDEEGKIDEENKKITVTLPPDITPEKLKDIIPEIVWQGEDISPDEDAPQDFNKKVEYIVTAENPDVTSTYEIVIKFREWDKTAKITSYEMLGRKGVIDEENKKITVTLPPRTTPDDLTVVVPKIVWEGKSISPDEDAPQDFNQKVEYTIQAEDPDVSATYEIIIEYKDLDTTAKITSFELLGKNGIIDETNHTITVTLPYNTTPEQLKSVVPNIVWEGESIVPNDDEAQNFNNPIRYVVTAEDPLVSNPYNIVIKFDQKPSTPSTPSRPSRPTPSLDKTAKIIKFVLLDKEGVIDDENEKIIVTLPYDVTPEQLKSVVPQITWEGKSIDPNEYEEQDFNKPIRYVVTAEDPSVKKPYDIIITFEDAPPTPPNTPVEPLDKTAKIIEFVLLDRKGEIDDENGKIVVTLPYDVTPEQLKSVVPQITWKGKSIDPNEYEEQDFNKPIRYVVTAEDPSVKKPYDIIITFEDAPLDKTAEIIRFVLLEKEGVIDNENGKITVILPYTVTADDLKNVVPNLIIWEGKSIVPAEHEAQNFNNTVRYIVAAEDPDIIAPYDIIIKFEDKPEEPDNPNTGVNSNNYGLTTIILGAILVMFFRKEKITED